MNLHRADKKPEWSSVAFNDRTALQRLAAATGGVVTLANAATFIGITLVIMGLFEIIDKNYWWGVLLIVVGRLCDILDGWLADITKTKSPLGEMLDAAIDKLGTVLTVIVFYIANLAPWWLLTALLIPHLVIIGIAYNARRRGVDLHPSLSGKLSMATLWVVLFGFVVIQAFGWDVQNPGSVVVYAASLIAFTLSIFAIIGYKKSN